MRRLLLTLVVLAAISFLMPVVICQGNEEGMVNRPVFIKESIAGFEYFYEDRDDWAKMLGWGKGLYRDNQMNSFLWFAWSDNNGYLQFDIDVLFPEDHLQEIRLAKYPHPINKPRWWQAEALEQQDITWVDTGRGLFNAYCYRQGVGKRKCDIQKILNKTIVVFTRFTFVIDMKVIEYLDKD